MLDLKQKRIELGLTMLDVAKAVGVSEATISRYESGNIKNMRRDRIEKYAKILHVSPSDFLDLDTSPTIFPASSENMILIPLIGRCAAGMSCYAEDNITGYIKTDRDIVLDGYEHFWLKVVGLSMSPMLLENDLVLVRKQNILKKECMAVVRVDDEDGVVKMVNIKPSKITLTSINPYFPPRVFEKEEMNRIHLVGKVIEIKRRLE